MLPSRGISAVRLATSFLKQSARKTQPARASHTWNYRTGAPTASKNVLLTAEIVQGFAWWWVLWHLWTQPDHITGEFDYPVPSQWTDAELGIPSD